MVQIIQHVLREVRDADAGFREEVQYLSDHGVTVVASFSLSFEVGDRLFSKMPYVLKLTFAVPRLKAAAAVGQAKQETPAMIPSTEALDRIKPSVSINEAVLNPFYQVRQGSDEREPDPALDGMATALAQARKTVVGVSDLAKALARDPTMTPAAAAVALRDKSSAALAPVLQAQDRARAATLGEIADIHKALDALPAVGTTESLVEGEIRTALARMNTQDRAKAIGAALEAGDERVAAAALRAPAMLSGMSETEQAAVRHHLRTTRNPAALERMERLKSALEAFDRSGDLLVSFTGAASNVEGVQAALKAQAETSAALQRIGA